MLSRAFRLPTLAFIALAALLLQANPARAYTPESGVWWNPNEPGTGLILDLQDNFLVVSLFVGDSAGNPEWYTSTGFLGGTGGNKLYQGSLDFFPGAQCIGCAHRFTNPLPGFGGPIRIAFNATDPARATLTLGGRTTQIERFRFYFKRPEDEQRFPGVSADLTRLMGEWSIVLDYSRRPQQAPATYLGDILIFDELASDNRGRFVDGCRPADSIGGFCTDTDIALRYAFAEYIPQDDLHVIVLFNSPTTLATYELLLDTNDFRGDIAVYNRGSEPRDSDFLPARGFRSASRTFVDEGTGPSRKAESGTSAGLPVTTAVSDTAAGPRSTRSKASLDRLNAARERLEARMLERMAGR